jgi:hypothetical protein
LFHDHRVCRNGLTSAIPWEGFCRVSLNPTLLCPNIFCFA